MTKRRGWTKPEVEREEDVVDQVVNYPVDVSSAVGSAMGPDLRGRFYMVVEATNDGRRLGLAVIRR